MNYKKNPIEFKYITNPTTSVTIKQDIKALIFFLPFIPYSFKMQAAQDAKILALPKQIAFVWARIPKQKQEIIIIVIEKNKANKFLEGLCILLANTFSQYSLVLPY